ncbi:hypothetical protein PF438_09570 [Elizabethkingia meningoseptica]|uniref:hypothetical protein n=1 Tax=Elizabethkingia TaxID=308865 RepID=UPI0022F1A5E8|nr:hypothetical protein [Elizabethkingia meningoseptica]EJK5330265.1 hypothetical protein [Elizabethkingia meningoseptica]WBS73155.1 hypothetical protein PF438_09570 [Elizabethkingia meningoseptica]
MIIVPLSRFRRSINKYADLAENETVMITISKKPVFFIKPVVSSDDLKKNPREGWEEMLKKTNSLDDKETFYDDF